MTAPLVVYTFRYKDTRTGKWGRARYKAERSEIAARHTEWEIIGPGEERWLIDRAVNPVRREGEYRRPGARYGRRTPPPSCRVAGAA